MNPHSQNLHRLLQDIVPATETELGPDRDALFNMVRRERARRRRDRVMLAAGITVFLGVLVLFRPVPHAPDPVVAAAPGLAPLVIHEVDDQQLLALMQDTPAALMEGPNGERTLLVLQQ